MKTFEHDEHVTLHQRHVEGRVRTSHLEELSLEQKRPIICTTASFPSAGAQPAKFRVQMVYIIVCGFVWSVATTHYLIIIHNSPVFWIPDCAPHMGRRLS